MPTNVAMKGIKEAFLAEGKEGIRKQIAKIATDALQCWKGLPKELPPQAKFKSSIIIGEVLKNDVEFATSYLAIFPA
jgi:hypothetical protein